MRKNKRVNIVRLNQKKIGIGVIGKWMGQMFIPKCCKKRKVVEIKHNCE